MHTEMQMLGLSVILGLVQLLLAASMGVLQYGIPWAFGNREQVMPPLPGMRGRTVRAFHNFSETFPLFAATLLLAAVLGHEGGNVTLGAELYFFGRLAYLACYMAGIRYLRTAAWGVSLAGIVLILYSLF
jgi:uncharacterized MAPEG superfamily protein